MKILILDKYIQEKEILLKPCGFISIIIIILGLMGLIGYIVKDGVTFVEFLIFFTFVITFSNIIPIILYKCKDNKKIKVTHDLRLKYLEEYETYIFNLKKEDGIQNKIKKYNKK